MAVNDSVTFNAALAAAAGSASASQTPESSAAFAAACLAFATQVDATVFAGGGAGANADRGSLMLGICVGVFGGGRDVLNIGTVVSGTPPTNPALAANYTNAAIAVNAAYQASKANLA